MKWELVRARLPDEGARCGFYAEARKYYHLVCSSETGVRVYKFKTALRTEPLAQSPKSAAERMLLDEYNLGVTLEARAILEEILKDAEEVRPDGEGFHVADGPVRDVLSPDVR